MKWIVYPINMILGVIVGVSFTNCPEWQSAIIAGMTCLVLNLLWNDTWIQRT